MSEDTFEQRLNGVRERVQAACDRSGRARDDVSIVVIAKNHGPERVREAADCGITIIGENRVQEAIHKQSMCPGGLEWHMVGHLQKNKVKHAVRVFRMIHSVDSTELLEVIDRACGEHGVVIPVCLQVNVSGEGSKFGMAPADGPGVLERCSSLMNVDVVGLMTIPPFLPDPEDARPYFAELRGLRDSWRDASGFDLEDLSMGMSGDFEVAIEEGATWVRLGTVLFGKRGRG
jgi:pyridoxal phosphate enzyme (YggS family)